MKYTNADFIRLMTAVDDEGGEHLDETCTMDELEFPMPHGSPKVVHTHGCEQETLFEIPYDPDETVFVQEPIMENDPKRPTYRDSHGNVKKPKISLKTKNAAGREEVMFEIVERGPEADAGGLIAAESVRVCAVGDNVGMWPRFRHVICDSESK